MEMQNGEISNEKIFWHDAFFEAIQLELYHYKDDLTFINEHPLNKEALIIDVMVIKKDPGITIEKNIGRMFREVNLLEFKSEKDSLTVRDYNKVVAYGYLYASFAPVDVSSLTLTFAVTVHPRKLLTYLEKQRGFKVTFSEDGICYVEGDTFPVQILIGKKLSPEKNLFLKNLRSNLNKAEAKRTFSEYKALTKGFERKNSYIDRLVKSNYVVIREVMNLNEDYSFEDFLQDLHARFRTDSDIEREKIVAQEVTREVTQEVTREVTREVTKEVTQEVSQEIAKNLKLSNVPFDIIVNSTKLPLEVVEAL